MGDLTFGEQVKIMLSRKNMTIKQLAEMIEERTGKAMSRQNLTQRLSRDNFQEQDMRLIAAILGCPFKLSIFPEELEIEEAASEELAVQYANNAGLKNKDAEETTAEEEEAESLELETAESEELETEEAEFEEVDDDSEEEILLEDEEPWDELEELTLEDAEEIPQDETENNDTRKTNVWEPQIVQSAYERARLTSEWEKATIEPEEEPKRFVKRNEIEEDLTIGELNPYTGHEYLSNSVRMHPNKIGYVQVYDRAKHRWDDMTEWAYLGYQERMKSELGKDYEPPIYLD